MTKRETWWFAVISTSLFALIFLAMTFHSHTRFDELTNTENLTPKVKKGKKVWHDYNCINCHTLMGEGAYYAPDLTEITAQRGEAYLKQFLKDPSQFYSPDDYGRVMPDLDMSDKEIDQVIAFLEWVNNIDRQGWPPRPIRVTGSPVEQDREASASPAESPEAKGRAVFNGEEAACNSCHSTAEGVKLVGPSMAGLVSRAEEHINSDEYEGDAETVEAYVRESIVEPDAFIVPGKNHANNGNSLMPSDYSERLGEEDIDHLVAYLMSLK